MAVIRQNGTLFRLHIPQAKLRIAVEMALNSFSVRLLNPTPEPESNMKPLHTARPDSEKDFDRTAPILRVNDVIFVKQNYQFMKVSLGDVLYLEADDIYTTVVTTGKKYAVRLSLGHMIERLRASRLARTHRSYVVNLDRIGSFSEHEVVVNGHSLPLGHNYKNNFLKHFPVC